MQASCYMPEIPSCLFSSFLIGLSIVGSATCMCDKIIFVFLFCKCRNSDLRKGLSQLLFDIDFCEKYYWFYVHLEFSYIMRDATDIAKCISLSGINNLNFLVSN